MREFPDLGVGFMILFCRFFLAASRLPDVWSKQLVFSMMSAGEHIRITGTKCVLTKQRVQTLGA